MGLGWSRSRHRIHSDGSGSRVQAANGQLLGEPVHLGHGHEGVVSTDVRQHQPPELGRFRTIRRRLRRTGPTTHAGLRDNSTHNVAVEAVLGALELPLHAQLGRAQLRLLTSLGGHERIPARPDWFGPR